MVDFHTHSNFSDGELSPEALIKKAVKHGLACISLTDHDTLGGLEQAAAAAKAENIRFIPGIELNIDYSAGSGGEFHLLGLGISSPSPAFIKAVEGLSLRRKERNYKILDKMYELSMINDIDSAWDELMTSAREGTERYHGRDREVSEKGQTHDRYVPGTSLGRLHFAALLIRKKIVKNVSQAFDRYLGAGKPLYVPKEGMKFDEAAALIRESGGISILAHPISLFLSWGKLPDYIKNLKDRGLTGLEAWHPTAKPGSCRRLEELAKKLGLYITEGSDFHGSVRPERRLGYSMKWRKIEDKVLEAIPELFTMVS